MLHSLKTKVEYMKKHKMLPVHDEEFSGTELSIANTVNAPFSELTLTGRYQQATPSIDNPIYPTFSSAGKLYTTGNNILDAPNSTALRNGLNFTYDKSNCILTINGTCTNEAGVGQFVTANANVFEPNTAYSVHWKYISGTVDVNTSRSIGVFFPFNNGLYVNPVYISSDVKYREVVIKITSPSSITAFGISSYIYTGFSFNNYKVQIQVVKGSYTLANIPKWSAPNNSIISIPELKATPDYADTVNIITGAKSVSVYEKVFPDVNNFKVHYVNNFNWGTKGIVYTSAFWFSSQPYKGRPICSHFPPMPSNESYYYSTCGYSFFYADRYLGFVCNHTEFGLSESMSAADQLAMFKAWVIAENNKGTPVTVWLNKNTASTTQLTPVIPKSVYPTTRIYDDSIIKTNKQVIVRKLGLAE